MYSYGTVIYKYRWVSKIGQGSFGSVWRAIDESIEKELAIKILPLDTSIDPVLRPLHINHSLQEAKIGSQLLHSNLAQVYSADILPDQIIIAMKYYKYGSILSRVNAKNFIPLIEGLKYIIQICQGLEYLHNKEIYHNDIKPGNILIGDNKEGILTDYGISFQKDKPSSKNFYKLHKAPECLNEPYINEQTDIYQLGLTFFRLLNGIGLIPEKWNTLGESNYEQKSSNGTLITSKDYQLFIPSRIRRIINKAINPALDKRYKSILSLRRDLEKIRYNGFEGVPLTV